jgi:hypothetical protein
MDKQAKKRDIAVFSNMMKELMNKPINDSLVTLDRDLQHFIYGRVATLVKHNDSKPIGSVSDISAVVGAALADVLKEFLNGRADDSKIKELFASAQAELVRGFEARTPVFQNQEQTEKVEEPVQ